MIKETKTNRKTGKKTTSYEELTPITKSQFNSSGAGKKAARPLTKSTGKFMETSKPLTSNKSIKKSLSTASARKEQLAINKRKKY